MSIEIIENGNIFNSDAQTLVNTVNCVGVMGKGIAKKYKELYPDMFRKYADLCKMGYMDIGKLWLYKGPNKWILNFPTKTHWKYASELVYLEKGLQKFMDTYEEKGIQSIAFPLLGASNGRIPPSVSLDTMVGYLKHCNIPISIYTGAFIDNENELPFS